MKNKLALLESIFNYYISFFVKKRPTGRGQMKSLKSALVNQECFVNSINILFIMLKSVVTVLQSPQILTL